MRPQLHDYFDIIDNIRFSIELSIFYYQLSRFNSIVQYYQLGRFKLLKKKELKIALLWEVFLKIKLLALKFNLRFLIFLTKSLLVSVEERFSMKNMIHIFKEFIPADGDF